MNIINLFEKNVETSPDKTALLNIEKSVTYKSLDINSKKYAHYFLSQNIKKNDIVLLFIPVSVTLYEIILGLLQIGAVSMFIDPGAGIKNIQKCCETVMPNVIIGCYKSQLLKLLNPLSKIKKSITTSKYLFFIPQLSDAINFEPISKDYEISDDDPALITFTSGSTGSPKAILRSHGFLSCQHHILCKTLNHNINDIELNTLPIFILSNLASGITTVLPDCSLRKPGAADPIKIINQLKTLQITNILASPAFCEQITNYLLENNLHMDEIKTVYTGGGPVFPNLIRGLKKVFPYSKIVTVYGSTEAEPISEIEFSEITNEDFINMGKGSGLLVGKPINDITLAIIPDTSDKCLGPFTKENFKAFSLSPGQIGEIVVSGDHVLKKYLNEDNSGIKFCVDNEIWHRTQDAGYLDLQGRLWLLGRCSAKVQDDAGIIYPFSIEAAAMLDSNIKRAAYIKRHDKKILVLEVKNKISPDLNIPNVDEIKILDAIPVDKRHNSKVLYQKLERML